MIPHLRLPTWLWLGALVVWTALLITPGDWFGEQGHKHVGGIGLGKILHMGFYAVLAGSAGWLKHPLNWRIAIIPLLIVHGGMTEIAQTFVPFREGCWRDVGIDTASVLTGFLITWRWWPV